MSLTLAIQVLVLFLGIVGAGFLAYLFQQFSVGKFKPTPGEAPESDPPST